MTEIRAWLSADGYRDPDDNLGLLVGSALARSVAKSTVEVRIGGVVFGDTKDGAQYRMLHPTGGMPASVDDGDPRYADAYSNRVAAGNLAFFETYADPAIARLAPGWDRFDLLAEDPTGRETWNYDPHGRREMTAAAWTLASDIRSAVKAGMSGGMPEKVVVYSAGGGAHVPAEALAYLQNQGFSEGTLARHFAVIQHGDTNWWSNQEPAATAITRAFTIVISEQDPNRYPDGSAGPGLKWLVRNGEHLEGNRFGAAFAEALAVAQGREAFDGLPAKAILRSTIDGSDAGSHAFAVDADTLLSNWWDRLGPGENVALDAPTLVDTGGGYRDRVIYDDFDWQDAVALMNGGGFDLL